jgi:hypothetical protein
MINSWYCTSSGVKTQFDAGKISVHGSVSKTMQHIGCQFKSRVFAGYAGHSNAPAKD